MSPVVQPGAPPAFAVLYRPSSVGGADDSANVAGLLANGVRSLAFADGQTYQWKSQLALPGATPITIYGGRNSGLALNIGAGNGAAILADSWNSRTPVTTLAGNVTQGSRTLSLAAAGGIVNGSNIFVAFAGPLAPVRAYTVVAGGGTTTLTVDRPILPPFLTGAQVSIAGNGGFPLGIQIIGNGMIFSGTADYGVELVGGETDCLISDLNFTMTALHWACSLDYGALHSKIERVRGSGSCVSWLAALEQAEGCSILDCTYTGTSAAEAFALNGSDGCRVERCSARGATIGLFATLETSGDTYSARRNVIAHCDFSWCGTGIWLGDSVTDTDVIDCTADSCTTNALILSPTLGTSPPNRARIVGGSYKGAPIVVDGGSSHRVTACDFSSGPNGLVVSGLYATSDLEIDACRCDSLSAGYAIGIAVASGGAGVTGTRIRSLSANTPLASNSINIGANVPDVLVEDCRLTDGGSGVGGGNMVTIGAGTGRFTFRGCEFVLTAATGSNNTYALVLGANNVVDVDNCVFNFVRTAASFLVGILAQSAGSWCRVRNTRGIGSGAGAGSRYGVYFDGAANFYDQGPGVDFSAFETPIHIAAGATTNRGSVTLSGTTGQVAAWAKTGANSEVRVWRTAAGATPGNPVVTKQAGVSITIAGDAAGQNSTIAYVIDGA